MCVPYHPCRPGSCLANSGYLMGRVGVRLLGGPPADLVCHTVRVAEQAGDQGMHADDTAGQPQQDTALACPKGANVLVTESLYQQGWV